MPNNAGRWRQRGEPCPRVAHHGRELGIPITVCMPIHAPLVKQRRCELLGAKVLRCGEHIPEAATNRDALAKDGLSYINGFDDPAVIAGQGTIGLGSAVASAPTRRGGGASWWWRLARRHRARDQNPTARSASDRGGTVRAASLHAAQQAEHRFSDMQATLADGLAVPKWATRVPSHSKAC